MNLLIDIGNTTTHLAIAGKTRILAEFNFLTHLKINQEEILKKTGRYRNKIGHAAISSVVPQKDSLWNNFLQKHFKIRPLIISHKTRLPIKLKIDKPST